MSDAAIALFVFGAIFELAGIVLVSSPDLIPLTRRFSAWLRLRSEILGNRLARLLGRPRDVTVIVPPGLVRARGVFPLSVSRGMSEGASLEAQVRYLLDRDREAQERENDHEKRLAAIEDETPERLEELRGRMELRVAAALDEAHREYLPARRFGALLLGLGLGCVTAANFV